MGKGEIGVIIALMLAAIMAHSAQGYIKLEKQRPSLSIRSYSIYSTVSDTARHERQMMDPIGGTKLKEMVKEFNENKICPFCLGGAVHIVHHEAAGCGWLNKQKANYEHYHGMCDGCLSDWIVRVRA